MTNSDQQELGQMGRVVRRTAGRLRIQHAMDGAGIALGACIGGVACVGLIARWLSIDFSAIGWLVSAAILSSMVLLIRWMQFDLTPLQAASVLDEELRLEEAISTAVHPWPDSEDPFVQLHRMHAEDVTSQISVRQAIRLHWPRSWWWPFAALLIYAFVVLAPVENTSSGAPALDMEAARTDTAASIEAVIAQLADSPDLKQSMDQTIALSLPPETNDAATLRRDSLKELTAVEQQLDAFRQSLEQKRLDALRDRMETLPARPMDAATEIRRSLRDGDFDRAHEALGTLTDSEGGDAEARAAALEQLSDDLAALAEDEESIRDMLQSSGVPLEGEVLPEDMMEMLSEATPLSEADREAIAQNLKAEEEASKALQALSDETASEASKCRGGEENPEGAAQGEMTMSKQLQSDDRASEQCEASRSACRAAARRIGRGLSPATRPGQGRSDTLAESREEKGKGEIAFEESQIDSTQQFPAPVISRTPAFGPLNIGETSGEGMSPITAAQQRAAEGFSLSRVPRRYRDLVAAWFAQQESGQGDGESEETNDP